MSEVKKPDKITEEPIWTVHCVTMEYSCPHCKYNLFRVYDVTAKEQIPQPIYDIVSCKNTNCGKQFKVFTFMKISPSNGDEDEEE